MAPRKKRSKTASKTNSKAKSTSKVAASEEILVTNAKETLTQPLTPPRRGRTASNHKKFGKFRCLLENSSSSETVIESNGETEEIDNVVDTNEVITAQIDNAESAMFESDFIEGDNSAIDIDQNVVQSDTIESSQMEYNEIESGDLETMTTEISQQFSSLNVDNQVNFDDPQTTDKMQERIENETVDTEDMQVSTDQVYAEDPINSEFAVECIAEEVIPVLNEQEIEIGNTCDIEEVDDSTTQDENIIQEEPSKNIQEQADKNIIKEEIDKNVQEETETVEENVQTDIEQLAEPVTKTRGKTSKVTPKKPNKPKTSTKKKVASQPKIVKKEPKTKARNKKNGLDKTDNVENSVRRSSRIKSISVLKQRSKGQGLVKPKTEMETKKSSFHDSDHSENSNSCHTDSEKASIDSPGFLTPNSGYDSDHKPVKVKSRWRRSSELEMGNSTSSHTVNNNNSHSGNNNKENCVATTTDATVPPTQNEAVLNEDKSASNEEIKSRLKQFVHLKENLYLTDRVTCKEAKKMTCDCFLTPEEVGRGEMGCGEDCLNRLLMIECGQLCPVNDRCTNKRFQKAQFSSCEVFRTEKKGLGIRATANIPYGEFILEYIGEVIGPDEFEDRATEYSKDKNPHYYFMSLRSDAVIDATQKGNISRFINHSCEPNAETQKWTVNGELRIGFFSKRTILAGEEITFDYQFQRYGKEAQKCFCEASTCRGWLGEEPDEDDDEEEEEEEEEEEGAEKEIETQALKSANEAEEQLIEGEVEASTEKTDSETVAPTAPVPPQPKKPIKKQKKKLIKRKVCAKDIFDDVDVDVEIEMLMTTGLKNQAHTLKLSRLMVRANDASQRTALLRILRHGEFPCRRLFLDYHGLRLIHGWMNDAQQLCKSDIKQESLRLELLQTLATLPISNKTILQDSKVLPTVQKWSTPLKDIPNTDLDSESNSPKIENESADPKTESKQEVSSTAQSEEKSVIDNNISQISNMVTGGSFNEESQAEEEDPECIRKSVGMDVENIRAKSGWFVQENSKKVIDDIIQLFSEEMDICKMKIGPKQEEKDYEVEITALAIKLLEEWSVLKEVFRIPKKERIEQMKEHEREANRGYKAGLEHDSDRKLSSRYRMLQRYRIEKVDFSDRINRKTLKPDSSTNGLPKINKYERRKLFAMQVEQEEVEKRMKQRDMWRQHELQCLAMGTDPRFTAPYDPTRNFHCIWNPQTGQWQNYPILNPMGPRFNPGIPYVYPSTGVVPTMPPHLSNMVLQRPNINLQPPNLSQPPPNMIGIPTNIPPPNMQPYPSSNHLITAIPSLANMTPNNRQPSSLESLNKEADVTQVKFAGPIPPPVKLPPKWKCAKDKYGRPYYYHIKIRISQWEPPEPPPAALEVDDSSDSTSSSETSSLSSDSSSEESDDDETDDTKLLLEIRKKFQQMESQNSISEQDTKECSPDDDNSITDPQEEVSVEMEINKTSSLDERLKEEFNLIKKESHSIKDPLLKRKRVGLVTEVHIISPRSEEDKVLAKENLRKYKETKEKLKRQKETNLEQNKKRIKVTVKATKKQKLVNKIKLKETLDPNSEQGKKIKETFRLNMAGTMVGILNPYRKSDCKEGRITNTEDFKHLARKLTHFVMVKELKHIQNIEDLTCTESVKSKAKEFVRKYMSKFGDNYIRPKDDPEY